MLAIVDCSLAEFTVLISCDPHSGGSTESRQVLPMPAKEQFVSGDEFMLLIFSLVVAGAGYLRLRSGRFLMSV